MNCRYFVAFWLALCCPGQLQQLESSETLDGQGRVSTSNCEYITSNISRRAVVSSRYPSQHLG
eukprot:4945621-Amphidinium_carterae.1